jgi:hypothetical protein
MKLMGGMLRLGRSVRGVRRADSRTVCRPVGLACERAVGLSCLARGVAGKRRVRRDRAGFRHAHRGVPTGLIFVEVTMWLA